MCVWCLCFDELYREQTHREECQNYCSDRTVISAVSPYLKQLTMTGNFGDFLTDVLQCGQSGPLESRLWIQRDGESEGQRNVIRQSSQLRDVRKLLQLLKHSQHINISSLPSEDPASKSSTRSQPRNKRLICASVLKNVYTCLLF